MISKSRESNLVPIREACSRFSAQVELFRPEYRRAEAVFWFPKAWNGRFAQIGSGWGDKDDNDRWVVCGYWRNDDRVRFGIEFYSPRDETNLDEWRMVTRAVEEKATALMLAPEKEQPLHGRFFQKFYESPLIHLSASTTPDDVARAVQEHLNSVQPKLAQLLEIIQAVQANIEMDRRRLKPGDEFVP